jgi:hypothetical protein
MRRVRIFVASPGDVSEERDIVAIVIDELRRIVGAIRNVELEAVRWETHAWPDVGEDAQAVINREIGEYDIFVGIMWIRFGTPTGRSASGTGEEFERAYNLFARFGRPRIMFYFKTAPFYSSNPSELAQFRKLVTFRNKLYKAGVLFWQYEDSLHFERSVREHLIRQLLEITARSAAPKHTKATGGSSDAAKVARGADIRSLPPLVFLSAARADWDRVSPVYRALAESGLRPWLDVQDLLPGEMWQDAIERAIFQARAFVVFVSAASVTKGSYVQKELRLALDRMDRMSERKAFLIPVRLDPVKPAGTLARLQWIDLDGPEGLERLIETIRDVVGSSRKYNDSAKPARSNTR